MLKKCTTCKVEKPLSEFRKDKTKPNGVRYECKECSRVYHKSKYKEQYSAAVKQRSTKRYNEWREHLLLYKSTHPCLCCGESEPVVLEFHHLDPTQKDFTIGGNSNRSWDKLLIEIEKCVVVCSNCHKKIHAGLLSI